MNIKGALNRIYWRFGGNENKNPFKVNEADINAYNIIDEYVKETQKKQYEANELFAKLYTYMAMKIMQTDGSTVFEDNHRKKIGNLLELPLNQIIENLRNSLNDSEQYGLLESIEHDFKHPATRKDGESTQTLSKLNELLKSSENIEKLTGDVWNFETVETALISEINLMINLHR